MKKEITLVDRGRGLQLSTSRITVHDLVPYFQEGVRPRRDHPLAPQSDSRGDQVVERYYRQHKDELDEYEAASGPTARNRFGCSGFVSRSGKEAAPNAWLS